MSSCNNKTTPNNKLQTIGTSGEPQQQPRRQVRNDFIKPYISFSFGIERIELLTLHSAVLR